MRDGFADRLPGGSIPELDFSLEPRPRLVVTRDLTGGQQGLAVGAEGHARDRASMGQYGFQEARLLAPAGQVGADDALQVVGIVGSFLQAACKPEQAEIDLSLLTTLSAPVQKGGAVLALRLPFFLGELPVGIAHLLAGV